MSIFRSFQMPFQLFYVPTPPGYPEAEAEIKINEMKVVTFEDSESQKLVVVRREIPTPKENEVIIKIIATTITVMDILRRLNRNTNSVNSLHPLLGTECSGEIVAVGSEVTRHRVADEVCAYLGGGGYAEYVPTLSWRVLPIPNGVRVQDAASLPNTALVVWSAFKHLKKKSTVLILNAQGEHGSLAIQLAKLYGCTVFASGIRRSQVNYCKDLGADFAMEFDGHFVDSVYKKNGGRGIDFIFDPYGFSIPDLFKLVSPGGTIVLAGYKGIDKVILQQRVLIEKRIKIVGLRIDHLLKEWQEPIFQEIVEELWPMFERGRLITRVYKHRFDFNEVEAAHELVLDQVNLGDKILIFPTEQQCC